VDVFAWTYDEMPGLDPGLVVHSLNVDLGVKPVVQLARVFHTDIKTQITQEVKKLLAASFINPASQMALQHSTHEKKKEWSNSVLCGFLRSKQSMTKR